MTATIDILTKALTDNRFAQKLQSDPSGALNGYELSTEERTAV